MFSDKVCEPITVYRKYSTSESPEAATTCGVGYPETTMNALIDFVLQYPVVLFYIVSGVTVILYSCFAKRMSFQGDFPWRPEERKSYEPTPRMRMYGVALGTLPLFYGLYAIIRHMPRR